MAGGRTGHYSTRANARQRAKTHVVQHSRAPIPGVEPNDEPRADTERSGHKNLDQQEEIGPRPGREQITAHRPKHVVGTDDAPFKDVPQDDDCREAQKQKQRTVIDQTERCLGEARR